MDLTEALMELANLTPKAALLWRQHMANEGVTIDESQAVHVWFTLEHDTFYHEPAWSANWVYFDEQGRTTTFLHERGNTPLEAVTALRSRTVRPLSANDQHSITTMPTMTTLTVRVIPCLDNDPTITYDVFVVDHPQFAAGGDNATTAVLDAVQRILAEHPRCTVRIETVEDFAPAVPALQAYARDHLDTDPPAVVLEHMIAELHAAQAQQLAQHLEVRRDLGQLAEAWQIRMVINKLAHTAALT